MKVFSNCTLFDGVNEETPDGMSVVVEGDRIREVTQGEVKPPIQSGPQARLSLPWPPWQNA